jgi:hypothetical protein
LAESAVAYTSEQDGAAAGRELSRKLKEAMPGPPPDALIVFASPRYDQSVLLRSLHDACRPGVLVGAFSAGELTSDHRGEGLACALALRSTEIKFAAGVGRGLGADRGAAARSIVSSFQGQRETRHVFRSALIMTDALAGHADDLLEQLTLTDAAVGLEILSEKPLGIGAGHGWEPSGPPLRVTEAERMSVVSINGLPAVEAFEQHAKRTGLRASTPLRRCPSFCTTSSGSTQGWATGCASRSRSTRAARSPARPRFPPARPCI